MEKRGAIKTIYDIANLFVRKGSPQDCRGKYAEMTPNTEFDQGIEFLRMRSSSGRELDTEQIAQLRRKGAILLTEGLLRMSPDEMKDRLRSLIAHAHEYSDSDGIFTVGTCLEDTSDSLRRDRTDPYYDLLTPMHLVGELLQEQAYAMCESNFRPTWSVDTTVGAVSSYGQKLDYR